MEQVSPANTWKLIWNACNAIETSRKNPSQTHGIRRLLLERGLVCAFAASTKRQLGSVPTRLFGMDQLVDVLEPRSKDPLASMGYKCLYKLCRSTLTIVKIESMKNSFSQWISFSPTRVELNKSLMFSKCQVWLLSRRVFWSFDVATNQRANLSSLLKIGASCLVSRETLRLEN